MADSLEADWNHKLRALTEAQEKYQRQREEDSKIFTAEQRAGILQLATDFPRLWSDPNTPDRERKRMLRLLLEDVTLLRGEQLPSTFACVGAPTRPLSFHYHRPHGKTGRPVHQS